MNLHIEDIFGNAPGAVAIAAGIAAGVLLLAGAVITFARRRLHNARETAGEVDDVLLDLFRRTNLALILFPAVWLGSRALVLPKELTSLISTFGKARR